MQYDPFSRGLAPVGVRTIVLRDETRGGRALELELWYPATEAYRDQDLREATQDRYEAAPGLPTLIQRAVRGAEPAREELPLVLFFHGGFAHRRYSSELCTHLASHGYLVVSPDFPGSTVADQMHDAKLEAGATPRLKIVREAAADRLLDTMFVLERVLEGAAPGLSELVDRERIGTAGQSFGGWTSLAFNSIDNRPKATFAIVPPGGAGPAQALSALLRVDNWGRDVPTFLLAAELDSVVTVEGVRQLYEDLRGSKRLAILRKAGHVHFGDDAEQVHEEFRAACARNDFGDFLKGEDGQTIDFPGIAAATPPFSELCPAAHGQAVVRSLCVSHMDAHLKQRPHAQAFLKQNLADLFAERGIDLEVSSSS
jgi:dienelactone hydrolase